jgi:hypothetical protein
MAKKKLKFRATLLHEALYAAAEGAEDLTGNEEMGAKLREVLHTIGDCIYHRDENKMRSLFREYGATRAEVDRDAKL